MIIRKKNSAIEKPDTTQVDEFIKDLQEMIDGTGRHAEHTRQQIGRCACCSCGLRVQGRLKRLEEKD